MFPSLQARPEHARHRHARRRRILFAYRAFVKQAPSLVRLMAWRPLRYALLPVCLAPGADCELPPAAVGRGPSTPD